VIFDIKRYAIHDGPGIRTTVFLKGCPLTCPWCHNPEGQQPRPQRMYHAQRCIVCGECIEHCPAEAITASTNGNHLDPNRCRMCQTCEQVCPADAVTFVGRTIDSAAVMAEVVKDIPFYDDSQGGVTFSGGEPLMQPTFLIDLLKACGENDIHRAVDTTGYAPCEDLMAVAEHTELFLYDIKHLDPQAHLAFTGVSNQIILENLKQLARNGGDITIRIPVIPKFNDSPAHLTRLGQFLSTLPGIRSVHLLPFHQRARAKYTRLGMCLPSDDIVDPPATHMRQLAQQLKQFQLEVRIGG
jgi:pyruvate formate lyase activating enzyme